MADKPRTYTTTELGDHDFYMANREDILRALSEGRIVDGSSEPAPYPAGESQQA